MLKFYPLKLTHEKQYTKLYNKCAQKASDSSFINIWAWDEKYHFEVAFENDLCWIRHQEKGELVYNYPIGEWEREDWKEILSQNFPNGFHFEKVPENLAVKLKDLYGASLNIQGDRDNWEYIYSVAELISLSGYRFRNKRKLANQFKQFYNYVYKRITSREVPDIREFQKRWIEEREMIENLSDNLKNENVAINRVLNDWEKLPDNLFGGLLSVGNNVVAYTIGEIIDDETIIIHFEKALFEYKGAYQAINRICLENIGNYKFVNREQDLGVEGLRKAKLEYNPIRYIKKYNLTL